jgi:hypothetical protein
VKAGTISANAAAIEAGWRKQPSPVERVRKALPELTDIEWENIKREEDQRRQLATDTAPAHDLIQEHAANNPVPSFRELARLAEERGLDDVSADIISGEISDCDARKILQADTAPPPPSAPETIDDDAADLELPPFQLRGRGEAAS